MSRPCKVRRVCALPGCRRFIPEGNVQAQHEPVAMSVDEFEAIRLIDLEEMTQEECARQMQVARTTAQAIYNNARKKLAQCLVNRRELVIEGGEYSLCEENNCGCKHRCGGCRKAENKKGEN